MKLYAGGYLTFYMPDQQPEVDHDLAEPIALITLLAEMGIPPGDVQLVIVNGEIVDLEQALLKNQDEVKVFPSVDGG
jgi:sulfur carrier protein ThiS